MSNVEPDTNLRAVYDKFQNRLDAFRKHHNAPLTLAEKVVYAHLVRPRDTHADRSVLFVPTTARVNCSRFAISPR
jgi:hypothetical protein